MTCGHSFKPVPTGRFPPPLNGRVLDAAATSGFSLMRRCPRASRENLAQPSSRGPWSGVTSLVSIHTTDSFQARTRCRKAALAISSRCRCNTCRAATAIVFFSPLISIRIPTSGLFCRASGECRFPKLKRWCVMPNAAVKSSVSGAVSPTMIQTKTRGRCRRRGRKRISRFPARCRRV